MIKIEEHVDIKNYSTLKVGGQFRYFSKIENKEDLSSVCDFAKNNNIHIFVLGGGSNIVFSDGVLNMVALKVEIKGFEIINGTPEHVDIKVGAGENWDNFVQKSVDMNLVGIEALSLIPGTVGASPVQNIGAYGSEVKDTIVEVEVFDTEKREFSKISNKDCNFGYRDSIFKNEAKGRYIITEVTYRLNKSLPSIPKYPGVAKYFEDMEIVTPNLSQIRDAIIYIRKEKLPDSNTTPNVGSFFKNPIVLNDVANRIKIDFPDAKFFSVDERHIKVPAGWLIENAGLKGKSFGNVSVYDKNALVLVNMKDASFEDIISARDKIIKTVKERFGIVLEQEPEII
jgi:UDP-N-acetylmuramate dehydrogenase